MRTKALPRSLVAFATLVLAACSAEELNVPATHSEPTDADSIGDSDPQSLSHPCPSCGGRMVIIETFERGCAPRYRPTVALRIDSS
jgi:hypothetical protein